MAGSRVPRFYGDGGGGFVHFHVLHRRTRNYTVNLEISENYSLYFRYNRGSLLCFADGNY